MLYGLKSIIKPDTVCFNVLIVIICNFEQFNDYFIACDGFMLTFYVKCVPLFSKHKIRYVLQESRDVKLPTFNKRHNHQLQFGLDLAVLHLSFSDLRLPVSSRFLYLNRLSRGISYITFGWLDIKITLT